MSAWMTTDQAQTNIAVLIAFVIGSKIKGVSKNDDRYESYNEYVVESGLSNLFTPRSTVRQIAVELHKLNEFSLNERYEQAAEKFDLKPFRMKEEYITNALDWVPHLAYYYHFGRHISPRLCQVIKSINCYTYQSCEGKARDTELYKALEKLNDCLQDYLIRNLPDMKDAKWE